MQFRRVVVTGLGVVSPIGNNVQDFWKNLISGLSGAAPITLFDALEFKTRFACEVKGFDPSVYLDRKEARKLDRFSQFAIACSDQALEDSGLLNYAELDKESVGVIWGPV